MSWKSLFCAQAQVVVAAICVVITTVELIVWWKPSLQEVYIVSMEALYFAAYAIAATGLSAMWLDERTPGSEE